MIPLLNAEPEGIAAFDHSIGEFYRSDTGWIRSIRTDRWRYLYNPEGIVPICRPEGKYFKVAREELYDHTSDPLELNNLVDQFPEVAASLRTKLLSVMDTDIPTQAPMRAGPEVIEQLKELGYLGD